jgi:hypothetical protein
MRKGKQPRDRALFERDEMQRAEKAYARHEIKTAGACGLRWKIFEKVEGGWNSNLWAEIVVLSGAILVHGDFEPCLFSGFSGGTPRQHVAWIGGHSDVDYPCGKASIGLGGSEFAEELNAEVLRADIDERRRSWKERTSEKMPKEIREAFKEAFDRAEDVTHQEELRAIVVDLIEAEAIDSEEASSMGVVSSNRVIMAHAALRRLHTLLAAAEAEKALVA